MCALEGLVGHVPQHLLQVEIHGSGRASWRLTVHQHHAPAAVNGANHLQKGSRVGRAAGAAGRAQSVQGAAAAAPQLPHGKAPMTEQQGAAQCSEERRRAAGRSAKRTDLHDAALAGADRLERRPRPRLDQQRIILLVLCPPDLKHAHRRVAVADGAHVDLCAQRVDDLLDDVAVAARALQGGRGGSDGVRVQGESAGRSMLCARCMGASPYIPGTPDPTRTQRRRTWSWICSMGLASPSSTHARTTRHSFCDTSASPRCRAGQGGGAAQQACGKDQVQEGGWQQCNPRPDVAARHPIPQPSHTPPHTAPTQPSHTDTHPPARH